MDPFLQFFNLHFSNDCLRWVIGDWKWCEAMVTFDAKVLKDNDHLKDGDFQMSRVGWIDGRNWTSEAALTSHKGFLAKSEEIHQRISHTLHSQIRFHFLFEKSI